MSLTFECVPSQQTKSTPVYVKWLARGVVNVNSQTPTFGDTTAFQQDVSWGFTGDGDAQGNPGNTFKGSNGKDHWASYEYGLQGGLYCPAHVVTGFSVDSQQDSTAGHGLWLRRIGLKFENFSGQKKFWGGAPNSSRNSNYTWNTMSKGFDSSEQASLDGYVVTKLIIEISSQGGTGTRETQLDIGRFRLHYSVGPANSRWVVGTKRSSPFSGSYVSPKGLF